MAAGELSGKVALVTGAGRNIGRAIALALAGEGARLGINVRSNVGEGQSVVDEIAAAGGQALLVRGDVTSRADMDRVVAQLTAHFGALDILVNNAAVRNEEDFRTMPLASWRHAFEVTLDGAFHATQASFDWLGKSGGGSVVNIGGMSASTGAGGRAHVVSAKAAIEGLTRALAVEFAAHGVTVNCVSPGLIETARQNAAPRHHATHSTIVGRRGRPEEVADAVLWLAGPGARYITGQTIHVNGGAYMA